MTRINTNVSSLNAQKSLARANVSLQDALTRLSTGLKINTGKDDPAGLIASEVLRSDITSTERAITNSERANQMIATADSALGAVSGLLNDIRGLVTESANTGALSSEQISANQLQVDSSLAAINRISSTTNFQGRKLLDGSLAFTYSETSGFASNNVVDLQLNQAVIGSTGSETVSVDITSAATQGAITATVPAAAGATAASYSMAATGGNLVFTAATAGAAGNDFTITTQRSDSVVDGDVVAFYDSGTGAIDLYFSNLGTTAVTDTDINVAISAATGAEVTTTTTGTIEYTPGTTVDASGATFTGGADATNGLTTNVVLEIAGSKGSEVLQFGIGTAGSTMESAINAITAGTGVTASLAGTTMTFAAEDYGSDNFVSINVISEDDGTNPATTFSATLSGSREVGTDIAATVNGISAVGKGNTLSVNSSTLSMAATVADGSSTDFEFDITGGGALFQLGPDVNATNQARMGIQSVNSATLQGASGRLYTLGSGQSNSLTTDTETAAKIADEVIVKITSLRGRLGAFQKTTLETNINTLTDTLENLTDAESSIRDADFAAESAALTRSQILVQSGVSVLGIANQNPQNVLGLLR